MNDDILQNFRNQIDEIDREILAILKRRSAIVAQVGTHKRATQKERCFLRPAREAVMVKELKNKDVGHFPNEFLYSIWRLLIAGSTNIEQTLTVSALADGNGLYLAREYFGVTAPITLRASEAEIIADIKSGHSLIGFMPHPSNSSHNWWLDIASDTPGTPKLFSVAPLVEDKRIANAYLIADVKPEATGDDKSWIVSNEPIDGAAKIAENLYELDGFHTKSNNGNQVSIGSYASQIRI